MLIQCESCSMFISMRDHRCVGCDAPSGHRLSVARTPLPSALRALGLVALAGVAGVFADLLVDWISTGARAEELFVGYALELSLPELIAILQAWADMLTEFGIGLGRATAAPLRLCLGLSAALLPLALFADAKGMQLKLSDLFDGAVQTPLINLPKEMAAS